MVSSDSRYATPVVSRRTTKTGVPPVREYLAQAFRYRTFAYYWSRADIKARNFETVLGRIWLTLNPFLFGLIYFVFVAILSGGGLGSSDRLAFIVGNLYAWGFFSATVITTVSSVQSGAGGILGQSAVPRIVLPVASTITAAHLFVRSLGAYIPLHLIASRGLHIEMLWMPLLILLTGLLGLGFGLFLAVINVYVRDVSRLLPHMMRLWLYLSPAIWVYTRVSTDSNLDTYARQNPMYSSLTAWTMAFGGPLVEGGRGMAIHVLVFGLWAIGTLTVGFLFFISREDEFAIRN
jgi:teichoic acid transport system permease protein